MVKHVRLRGCKSRQKEMAHCNVLLGCTQKWTIRFGLEMATSCQIFQCFTGPSSINTVPTVVNLNRMERVVESGSMIQI